MISRVRGDWGRAGSGESFPAAAAAADSRRPRRGRPSAANAAGRKKKLRKPYPSFPLTPHPRGQFVKKIRGKLWYFGSDPDEALRRYHEAAADLHAGREPHVVESDSLTVKELANRFLAEKDFLVQSGELTAGSLADYHAECERLIQYFGKGREVSSISEENLRGLNKRLAQGVAPPTLKRRVVIARMIIKFASDERLISQPLQLKKLQLPKSRQMRQHRAQAGRKDLHADEIRTLVGSVSPRLKAAILLGINCGYGNKDIAMLRRSDIDLDGGWSRLARSKTGVPRACPLWPETIAAIREFVKHDDAPEDSKREPSARGLLFVTKNGLPMVRSVRKTDRNPRVRVIEHDVLSSEFKKAMVKAGISLPGVSFYGLRHAFSTIGGETGLVFVVDSIMGHAPSEQNMSAMYRHGIDEALLRRVAEHVRVRVFANRDTVKQEPSSAAVA